jgi:hypothetical protein
MSRLNSARAKTQEIRTSSYDEWEHSVRNNQCHAILNQESIWSMIQIQEIDNYQMFNNLYFVVL